MPQSINAQYSNFVSTLTAYLSTVQDAQTLPLELLSSGLGVAGSWPSRHGAYAIPNPGSLVIYHPAGSGAVTSTFAYTAGMAVSAESDQGGTKQTWNNASRLKLQSDPMAPDADNVVEYNLDITGDPTWNGTVSIVLGTLEVYRTGGGTNLTDDGASQRRKDLAGIITAKLGVPPADTTPEAVPGLVIQIDRDLFVPVREFALLELVVESATQLRKSMQATDLRVVPVPRGRHYRPTELKRRPDEPPR